MEKEKNTYVCFVFAGIPIFLSIVFFVECSIAHRDIDCIDNCDYHWKETVCNNTDIWISDRSFYYTYEDCYETSPCNDVKCLDTQGKDFLNTTNCCKNDFTSCTLKFIGNYKINYWIVCNYDEYKRHFKTMIDTEETAIPNQVKVWFNTKYKEKFWEHLRYDDPLQSRRDYYNNRLKTAIILLCVGLAIVILLSCIICGEVKERKPILPIKRFETLKKPSAPPIEKIVSNTTLIEGDIEGEVYPPQIEGQVV